jgi:NAD(P)-dependent dehydrogenase (short-subunit alcohol dehydrogenase family)
MQRTAVVTGGAGGIGSAIVSALAATGHDVAIVDREGEFAVDLGDLQAIRQVTDRLGPRDVLVHAAAGLVAFLASDAASAITGQTLVADGGSVLR